MPSYVGGQCPFWKALNKVQSKFQKLCFQYWSQNRPPFQQNHHFSMKTGFVCFAIRNFHSARSFIRNLPWGFCSSAAPPLAWHQLVRFFKIFSQTRHPACSSIIAYYVLESLLKCRNVLVVVSTFTRFLYLRFVFAPRHEIYFETLKSFLQTTMDCCASTVRGYYLHIICFLCPCRGFVNWRVLYVQHFHDSGNDIWCSRNQSKHAMGAWNNFVSCEIISFFDCAINASPRLGKELSPEAPTVSAYSRSCLFHREQNCLKSLFYSNTIPKHSHKNQCHRTMFRSYVAYTERLTFLS